MYESRFGISGPPFQLSPDPTFYFDSRGHHQALGQLRRALGEESGVVVVSGEIGAGKTTLVRTLVAELDKASLSVAHIVSTQLDAAELLAAVLIGFGVPVQAATQDELASKLLRYLVKLDKDGHRALLIIDEAQNLHRDAFDTIVSLLTRKGPRRLPLQVLLVGQPELRAMVESGDLTLLRRLVTSSCHLGPIERDETGGYIEHRLRKVGWNGAPSFEQGAFDEIFRWTQGVPRRINLLCNRLMLSRFLASETTIDVPTVAQAARDLRAEIGESTEEPAALAPPARHVEAEDDDATITSVLPERPHTVTPRLQDPLVAPMEPGPLLCIAAGLADHVKAAALMRSLGARPELPSTKLARVHNNDALDLARALFAGLDVTRGLINLGIAEGGETHRRGELQEVFEFVVDHVLPRAVIVFDGSEAALACGTVAHRKHVPLIHIGAGLRTTDSEADRRKAIDELADLLYTTDAQASETLAAEGMPPEKVHCVGNLLMDAMQVAVRASRAPGTARDVPPMIESLAADRSGYGVVVLSEPVNLADRGTLLELITMLRDVSRDLPLAWPMQGPTMAQLKKHRLAHFIDGERIARLAPQPYPEYIALLRGATCVLTDSWDVQEEATALCIPCLTVGQHPERTLTVAIGSNQMVGKSRAAMTRAVWECIFNGGKRGRVPELWDGKSGARIANFLSAWLPAALEEERQRPQF